MRILNTVIVMLSLISTVAGASEVTSFAKLEETAKDAAEVRLRQAGFNSSNPGFRVISIDEGTREIYICSQEIFVMYSSGLSKGTTEQLAENNDTIRTKCAAVEIDVKIHTPRAYSNPDTK